MTSQSCEIGVLFGDVAGSTRLYESFGDRIALGAIETCLRALSGAAIDHGGTVVKTIGDELMAVFSDPVAMFNAAVAMQRAISGLEPVVGPCGTSKLHVRIGLHFGPAIAANSDFFGNTVNVAARMVGIARGGQIITTGEFEGLLPPAQRRSMRALDRFPVEGKAEETRIVEVIWQDAPDMTTLTALRRLGRRGRCSQLRITYGERAWLFGSDREAIAIGRESSNDVVVPDRQASRKHATIKRRRDKWILVDHSTNGTFITFSGEPEIRIHLEEMFLHRTGTICLGHSTTAGASDCVHFALT